MNDLEKEYKKYLDKNIYINMSRGVPDTYQLDLSNNILDVLNSNSSPKEKGVDYRNYGLLDGIEECKKIFSEMLDVPQDNIIVGGNSSLALMYNAISKSMTNGVCGSTPWSKLDKVKWLCPVPGYDRHFAICEYFGIEMINIPMNGDGPDMDLIEQYIKDASVKGIWCVPKYSNPTGITYSDKVVKRFAKLKPAAKDFRIYWDNAYAVHDLYKNKKNRLLNIFSECKKSNNEDIVYIFTSTSKITFPGAGVSAMALSDNNKKDMLNQMRVQTIGYDKINQYRHALFLKDIKEIMKKHADILRPKFELVDIIFSRELAGIATWSRPLGGYFVSLNVKGCAKEVVERCKKAGVILTSAGATYPYGIDPINSNIRIAPSAVSLKDLETALKIICLCVKLETKK